MCPSVTLDYPQGDLSTSSAGSSGCFPRAISTLPLPAKGTTRVSIQVKESSSNNWMSIGIAPASVITMGVAEAIGRNASSAPRIHEVGYIVDMSKGDVGSIEHAGQSEQVHPFKKKDLVTIVWDADACKVRCGLQQVRRVCQDYDAKRLCVAWQVREKR